jgi:putative FmdB family regulatory protein
MPLYEYKCHTCDEHFDVLQKFSDEPLKVHEGCGGELERLISPSALQFKGTGWYVTDYAHGKNPSGGSNGKSESEKSESGKSGESGKSESTSTDKSETKSESKSESKTESKPSSKPPAKE